MFLSCISYPGKSYAGAELEPFWYTTGSICYCAWLPNGCCKWSHLSVCLSKHLFIPFPPCAIARGWPQIHCCPLDPSCSLDQQYQSSHAGRLTKHTQAVNGTSTPFQSQSRHNNRAANIDLMVQTFKTSYFSLLWLSKSVVGSFLRNEILQINHLEEMNINRKVS